MDSLDFKITTALLQHGRITWTELASQLSLSIPTVTERVRKLEEQRIITGYAASLDYGELGFALTALIFVTLGQPQQRAGFIKQVQAMSEVLECLHITGDDDYQLKVICRDSKHLDELLSDRIKGIAGVIKTRTMLVLSTQKERTMCIPEVIKKGIK